MIRNHLKISFRNLWKNKGFSFINIFGRAAGLGASVQSIVGLQSRDFLSLVIIALVIAIPIACFVMNKWLQDFAYRINIDWWVFPLAGIIAILIAFLTISFQTIKAAISSLLKSLRTE